MAANGRPALRRAPHPSEVPGIAIFVTVIAINLVGEALNETFDPRRRRR
jgi:peptide/nickel transport system permease protein